MTFSRSSSNAIAFLMNAKIITTKRLEEKGESCNRRIMRREIEFFCCLSLFPNLSPPSYIICLFFSGLVHIIRHSFLLFESSHCLLLFLLRIRRHFCQINVFHHFSGLFHEILAARICFRSNL